MLCCLTRRFGRLAGRVVQLGAWHATLLTRRLNWWFVRSPNTISNGRGFCRSNAFSAEHSQAFPWQQPCCLPPAGRRLPVAVAQPHVTFLVIALLSRKVNCFHSYHVFIVILCLLRLLWRILLDREMSGRAVGVPFHCCVFKVGIVSPYLLY